MPEPAAEERLRWCPTCRSSYRADFARCPIDGDVIVEADTDPLIGQTLGTHYVIDSFIGEGAMARVYRAHHALLAHKQFAIKVMIGDLAATLAMRLRFAQEADAASQLEHPNVVSVIDFGKTDGGLMFIAMELIDGRSLAEIVAREAPLAPARTLNLARQICLGLGHAHERGLVHRDLKPDNVIVTGSPEQVRIVDFGLAIPIDDERSPRLTSVGLSVGTPLYVAPEQANAELVDHRADLFALGVTMFEMLTGAPPFKAGVGELLLLGGRDPALAMPRTPPRIEAIVRRLMRVDPAARYANTAEVIEAIDDAVRDMTVPIALPIVQEPPPPRRRGAWIVAASVLVVGVLVAGAVFITRESSVAPVAPAVEVAKAQQRSPEPAPTPVVDVQPTPVDKQPTSVDEPTPVVIARPAKPKIVKPDVVARPHVVAGSEPATPELVKPEPVKPELVKPEPGPVKPEPANPLAKPEPGPAAVNPRPATPEPANPEPKPTPIAKPLWTTADVSIAALQVRGPLADADVRRAFGNGLAAMRACYQRSARATNKSPATTVRISLSFDESRRASGVTTLAPGWTELGACIKTAAEGLRIGVTPDVGSVAVVVDIAFKPVAP